MLDQDQCWPVIWKNNGYKPVIKKGPLSITDLEGMNYELELAEYPACRVCVV